MDGKGGNLVRRMSRFLLVAVCALVAAVSSVQAVEPAAAPATQLADGTWTVQGRAIQGTRRCGDWLVRLTNRQGELSGWFRSRDRASRYGTWRCSPTAVFRELRRQA